MRWTNTTRGTRRTVSGFLWLPKQLLGEWRWLERATWVEWYDDGAGMRYAGWYAEHWTDEGADHDGQR